ncbi:MAG: peptide-methionine (S)-S-oxide reductase MsrA [Gemmataceae bacterium]|nr:peptide-methionine (S)-S-oxide reductase MsrA [Gemmataceae bacterium]
MIRRLAWLTIAGLTAAGVLLAVPRRAFTPPADFPAPEPAAVDPDEPTVATFGAGCFWSTDALFRRVKGVTGVASGYSGGTAADATYKTVCGGGTGHAEAVQVRFDPAVVSYPELLHVFWRSHDPTTPDRQGADAGPQYRSVVFAHSNRQREQAERYKAAIDAAGVYPDPVVTVVVPFAAFYPAEGEHQDYFANNRRAGYCRAVIAPKLDKLRAVFGDKLQPE